jgi:GNAT superfamily N-acetyltransferase
MLAATFACGVEPIDRYLQQRAKRDAQKRVAATYLLVEDRRIAGFYTLSADTIRGDDLSAEQMKRLKVPGPTAFRATLIRRLARDLSFKGQGLGKVLLADALHMAWETSKEIGSMAVVVDAWDEKAWRFYSRFGFLSFPETRNRLFIPMQTIQESLRRR